MAIITSKGKLSGKVGNLVYKEVNGKTVVSSLPRRKKGWFKAGAQHQRFKLGTRVSSRVYRQLKEFFLNLPPGDLSNKLTSLFIHSHDELVSSDPSAGWKKIEHDGHIWFPNRVHPDFIVYGVPSMKIEENQALIKVPSFTNKGYPKKRHYRVPYEVEAYERAVTIIHYDFRTESAQVIYTWQSERYCRYPSNGERVYLSTPLVNNEGKPIEDGLLVAAFNIRAYAAISSTAYLNSKNFNPLSIIGVWVKG